MMSLRKFDSWQTVEISSKLEMRPFFEGEIQKIAPRAIFLFSGEVGVGKTEGVKNIAEILNLGHVASPSFAIHHRYENPNQSLDHIDLYRLNNEDDLESTGIWDLFLQERSLIVIEWPERIQLDWLPGNWMISEYNFSFSPGKIGSRMVQFRHEIF